MARRTVASHSLVLSASAAPILISLSLIFLVIEIMLPVDSPFHASSSNRFCWQWNSTTSSTMIVKGLPRFSAVISRLTDPHRSRLSCGVLFNLKLKCFSRLDENNQSMPTLELQTNCMTRLFASLCVPSVLIW